MAKTTIPGEYLADGGITVGKMAANSVDSDQYVDGSIDLIHMSVNSIDSDQYVDGSIDLIHMSVNSIDSDQYVDGSIDTIHIADGAITSAKLDTNIAVSGTLTVTGDANFDSNTLFVDASANAVGIGTDSPVTALEISTDGTDQLTLNRADASISTNNTLAGIVVSADDPTANRSGAKIGFTAGDNWTTNYFPTNIIFSNDDAGTMTERLRIDASGNVLAGKTAVGMANEGIELNTGNYLGITKDSAPCAYLRRNTNDGTIIEFRKDTATVGSIGTQSTANFAISSLQAGHGGLEFGTANIMPLIAGVITDNAMDVGQSSWRFKDLYLSGTASVGHVIPNTQGTYSINHLGVYSGGITVNAATSQTGYLMSAGTGIVGFGPNGGSIKLGGTAAANELDDYEEGTFTPTVTTSSGTVTLRTDYDLLGYTKIGRVVTITGMIVVASISSPSGTLVFGDLPFEMLQDTDAASQTRPSIHLYAGGSGAPNAGYYSAFINFVEGTRAGALVITYNSTYDDTCADWMSVGSDLFINFSYHTA
jgi:hypothetical protein